MIQNDDSTMVASEATGTVFKQVECKNKSKQLKTTPVQKIPVQHTYNYTIHAYFPQPHANAKFNPSSNMRQLLMEMLKYDSTIMVISKHDKEQIQLATDVVLTTEAEFNKYFAVTNNMCPTGKQPRIIIGCHLMSEWIIRDIKFDTTHTTTLLDWHKKHKIFIKSDSLGITKTATIGYLSKLHPHLTNHQNLKPILEEALSNIVINPALAIKLDPMLKSMQEEAITNGNMFIPPIPQFEVYLMQLSYGRNMNRVETDIISIKCSAAKAHLLREFFTQLSNPMELETQIGVFVPTGAVHMIGLEAYKKLLCDHNAFLQSVTTVPIGDFQHEMLEIPFSYDNTTDIDSTMLSDMILKQPWCISVEHTKIKNKVLLVTTKGQLVVAHKWVNNTLPTLYNQHIPDKIDVTTLQAMTPCHLDKPILTASAFSYADKLKQRTSYITNNNLSQKPATQPPCTRIVKLATITFEEQKTQKLTVTTTAPTQTQNTQPQNSTDLANQPPALDYQANLQCIMHEIKTNLKQKFEAAIARPNTAVNTLETTFEQKLNQQIEQVKATQADKMMQDCHSHDLWMITDNLNYLISQLAIILDKPLLPLPQNSSGKA